MIVRPLITQRAQLQMELF